MRATGRTQAISQTINRPTRTPGEETNPWFWHPGRVGVQTSPEWFRKKLNEIDPDLEVTWNRDSERWQVWVRKPSVQTKLCQGWFYLFPVQLSDGRYAPLDERTLAKIFQVSARAWGNGRQYFQRVVDEMDRDKALAEKASTDEVRYKAGEHFDYTLPKVGYGPISSSKVVGQ